MSIIDAKYKGKYKEKDWLGQFIEDRATDVVMKDKTTTAEDGTKTVERVETSKRALNLDNLFALAQANGIDTSKMEEQKDRKNAPGRIRMTLGNSLRAAARKRHGLYDADKEWHDTPAGFAEGEPTETRDGEKIKAAKPEAEKEQGEADAA